MVSVICTKHQVANVTSCHVWQYETTRFLNLAGTQVANFLLIYKQAKIFTRNGGSDQSIYLYHGINELGNHLPLPTRWH